MKKALQLAVYLPPERWLGACFLRDIPVDPALHPEQSLDAARDNAPLDNLQRFGMGIIRGEYWILP